VQAARPAPVAPVRSVRPQPAPARRMEQLAPARREQKRLQEADLPTGPIRPVRREKIIQGKDREPLKAQRSRKRRRTSLVLFIFILFLIGGAFTCLWLPSLRIQHIEATGQDSDAVQGIADTVMASRVAYIFPRNSIFFFPEDALRAEILQQYPDISAVAISRVSFTSIAVNTIPREKAFIWCGEEYQSASVSTSSTNSGAPQCYEADGQGVVFAALSADAATSTAPAILRIYGPLTQGVSVQNPPLGLHIEEASLLPNMFAFIKKLRGLSASVTTVVLRDDEVDAYTTRGTRITYVIGREDMAEQLAESAFPSLNLDDGTLDYVDLRFDGKVYFKKVGVDTQTTIASSTSSGH
jgi:hypothetical protein